MPPPKAAGSKPQSFPAPAGAGHSLKKKKIPGAKKIKMKELPAFTRQLGAMLSAGLPVVQTLEALQEQSVNKIFQGVIAGVKTQIEGGASFSEALAQYPDIFDDLYISMLRAGESGGLLAETTTRIATFLEASARLRRTFRQTPHLHPVNLAGGREEQHRRVGGGDEQFRDRVLVLCRHARTTLAAALLGTEGV